MKRLKQQILWNLSGGVECLRPTENFSFMAYSGLYWRLRGYKAASVRGAVNELIVNNLVTKLLRGKKVWLRLTRVGRDKLLNLLPLIARGSMGGVGWDKNWRLVICNEKVLKLAGRRKLKTILAELGFVKLARGVYVSPFGVGRELSRKFIEEGWTGAVKVLLTKKFLVGDDRAFASEVWKLDTIYKSYQILSSRVDRLLYQVIRAKGLTDQLKKDYRECLSGWFSLLKTDPGLPRVLVPEDWPTLEVLKQLEKVDQAVRELEREAAG